MLPLRIYWSNKLIVKTMVQAKSRVRPIPLDSDLVEAARYLGLDPKHIRSRWVSAAVAAQALDISTSQLEKERHEVETKQRAAAEHPQFARGEGRWLKYDLISVRDLIRKRVTGPQLKLVRGVADRMALTLSMLDRISAVLDPEEPLPEPKRSRRLKRLLEQAATLEERVALLRQAGLSCDLSRLERLGERLDAVHDRVGNKDRISADEARQLSQAATAVRREIGRLARRDPDVESVLTMEALASFAQGLSRLEPSV